MAGTQRIASGGLVLEVGAVTDVGLKRRHNEDSILVLPAAFVVADGMGGYEAGDQASQAVVGAFREAAAGLERMDLDGIVAALELADDRVAGVAGGTRRGAGSTVVGAVLVELDGVPNWLVFNVGDSRAYRQAGAALEQITVDHSLGQELYAAGRITAHELATFKDRNVITRAIGASEAEADSYAMPVRNGERILLCSDGLSTEVPDELIRATMAAGGAAGDLASALVELAKRGGGRDNISVIVIDCVAGGQDFDVVAATVDGQVDDFLDESTAPVPEAV